MNNRVQKFLNQKLPRDLVNLIEEFAKDRTNYNKVIKTFEQGVINSIQSVCFCGGCDLELFFCDNECRGLYCSCEFTDTFNELKTAGNCFDSHMEVLTEILKKNEARKEFYSELMRF